MGLMAFDLDINEPVFAKNAIKKEKGRYICPSCASKGKNVPIYLSEKQTGNCFVSYDKSQHDDDCDFPIAYNAEYHNAIPENFSLEDIYNNAAVPKEHEAKTTKEHRNNNVQKDKKAAKEKIEIKSLYDLYRFCTSNEPTYTVGSQKIQDFYIALSTKDFWYKKRREVDNVLVLAVGLTCQILWKEHRIRLVIDKDLNFKVSITFDDYKYFDTVTSIIKKYNSSEVRLFVSGYASSKKYSFTKNNEIITYSEISIKAVEDTIHFLSRKKNVL